MSRAVTEKILGIIKRRRKKNVYTKVLEIGVAGGVTTSAILKVLDGNGIVFCCDPFIEYNEKKKRNHKDALSEFKNRVSRYIDDKSCIYKREVSSSYLRSLLNEGHEKSFNIIYIDGAHDTKTVLQDFILSNSLIASDGVIIFDDYLWIPRDKRSQRTIPPVKLAVEFLAVVWSDEYKIFRLRDDYDPTQAAAYFVKD